VSAVFVAGSVVMEIPELVALARSLGLATVAAVVLMSVSRGLTQPVARLLFPTRATIREAVSRTKSILPG
jgi:hypothetical protein